MREKTIVYPVWGDYIRFLVNVGNVLLPGRTYKIIGTAFGKPQKDGIRGESWEIKDVHNHQEKTVFIPKRQFNRLFKENKIVETQIKTI